LDVEGGKKGGTLRHLEVLENWDVAKKKDQAQKIAKGARNDIPPGINFSRGKGQPLGIQENRGT